ncbi:DUF2497 domain-containing protein [Caulobacter mirabilis]|uniref:Pole-organizing protein PopZ n=1 Tax=Caulobacter mirabilis TaxID=69666 RepID=A0A2D2AWY0_9CAUL|nr:DUF2497 domain-containing protein [Caulobacter mirabilis]ATQ42519.1 pole-organizing protein PopZ [Caulobacter mirabilis]
MSEQTAQEPTMEEILASIRRIISEDDAPAAAAEPAPAPEPEPVFAAEPEPAPLSPEEDDDVLELTQTVPAVEEVQTVGDLDVYTPAARAPEPEPAWEPEPEPVAAAPEPEPVVEAEPVFAAAAAPSYTPGAAAISGGMTIEELVRSILEPKLNEWADQNLDGIVRSILREKLDRVFR